VSRRSWTLLVAIAALWGSSYYFIKIALEDISPAAVVCFRCALGALALLPLAVRRDALAPLRGRMRDVLLLAVVQVAVPFVLISLGEQHISSSLAGILVAAVPVWTALLAPLLDREESLGATGALGVGVGIVGVALILGLDVGAESAGLVGAAMVLGASLCYALSGFLLKRRLSGLPAIGVVTATMIASTVYLAPAALLSLPSHAPGLDTLGALAVLGVGSSGIAFVFFYLLISDAGPARAALVTYVAPAFAVVYGVTLLDESFTLGTAAGLVLIVAGSWIAVEGRRFARPPAPA
jgi:drug/metabolite transporter (DMT)-like permease